MFLTYASHGAGYSMSNLFKNIYAFISTYCFKDIQESDILTYLTIGRR